ncbi:uncharacterized protein TrAFT101_007163 [Trichoderma asperellum]|uniref:HMG box domain-containing protein n=1 Tax=Trichoderma asperellum (strain ATCC 204424 / CBS 433.97 / NBRC 101777) TaxID=1042311 RepID=A0A2T3YWQ1_TRIA4|nr:hypothetical protein M441DRAFT_149858 [Trichoderma asperellum CBS 433.97]PTB36982.1 hypothetical protein M441DRAFT_149858 [Trichoderma asperellum CBS 433.97]UKZ92200.1 hypothetical protein TrAFT101_007163 [Trichoderma asperellum]
MLSSAALTAARRVLTSTGAAAPLRQSVGLAARALVLRPAAPSLRLISTSAPVRAAAAKATKSKSTKSSTKKPASKKTAKPKAKKPVKKKAIKKKAAVKKPKKAPKKKVLTDEQKDRLEIKRLRQMALLKGPTLLPETAWNVFMVDNVRAGEGSLVDKVKALATSFKNLPESERERMAAVGHSNKIANQEAKKKWIESFPPEAIHAANLARRRLARKTDKSRTYLIHDERIPQRTGSGFTFFIKEHFNDNGGSPKDAMRSLSERWKALSNDEKAPYLKKAADIAEVSGAQLKELREKGAKYWKEKLASAKV